MLLGISVLEVPHYRQSSKLKYIKKSPSLAPVVIVSIQLSLSLLPLCCSYKVSLLDIVMTCAKFRTINYSKGSYGGTTFCHLAGNKMA